MHCVWAEVILFAVFVMNLLYKMCVCIVCVRVRVRVRGHRDHHSQYQTVSMDTAGCHSLSKPLLVLVCEHTSHSAETVF